MIEEHGLKENKELKGFVKAAWSHYQRLKSKKKGNAYILQGASDLAVQMEKDQSAKSMLDAKEYMFQYGIAPLKLVCRHDDGSTVCLWQNHTPNASRTL